MSTELISIERSTPVEDLLERHPDATRILGELKNRSPVNDGY